MLRGRGPDEGPEVGDELRHLAHSHPLATGPAVPAVVEGIDDQAGSCEPLRYVVVATCVFAVTVGQHDDSSGFGVRSPHVIDDADPTYAHERSLSALYDHEPRVVGASN
jgi:hypothetical protein